ncbi:MAG: lysophospholipase [Oceanotoga sp.]|uniref:Alpha-beta hydrolase superfamily lysophospholipase n=1 Tax=Oceanotoga teriensis TaxID=515440 RepID=A0AA45C676_9BACT|nr:MULTISPECIES: alpha/beta fold hydrolase [Oceanotoga]MDN5343330.1 lysophospholipase [Oceanotoga sp.]PWJ90634.1 alpha-beta hydrolase superfamily lysophospholipase [Oceanotoga teriensis]
MELYTRKMNSKIDKIGNFVIIHGLGEHSGRYAKLISLVNEKGYDVYTFDLPGHGNSKGKRGDIPDFYELYKFIEDYVPNEYILFGHSLGGCISTRFTEYTEKKPLKLILSSPALGDVKQKENLIKILSIFPKMTVKNGISPELLSTNKEAIKKYLNDPLVHDKVTIRFIKNFFVEAQKALEEIDQIKIQTRLIYGTEDYIINKKSYDLIKNENIEIIPMKKGKHELFECEYNQDEFYKKILEML